ncbi:MAG: Bcr/CflA family drug resistance efflux transporter, partial [Hyphomonadaceae bacterium]|nr:Bcr/CflA family drug resistance efflux transporter [Hyphomonadaceae bacterium]
LLQLPWEFIFGTLTLMSVAVLIWIALRLKETLPPERRRPINLGGTLSAYGEVFRSRGTFGYMLASGVIFGALFAFIGSSEQVFTEVFGKTETFVYWFAVVALTLAAANFTNSRLVEHVGMRRMSQAALLGFIFFAVILLILMLSFGPVFVLFIPFFALMFACFGMIGSNFNAMAMEPLGKIAGVGSAAYGFSTTTVSSAIGWLIGQQYNGTVIPILTGFVVLGSVCFIIVTVVERGRLFTTR